MKAYPIPSITQLIDENKYFTLPFRNWFRDLSSFWNDSNLQLKTVTYSVLNQICFIEYSATLTETKEITLPFKPSTDSIIRLELDGEYKSLPLIKGVDKITLPIGVVVLKDWYLI